MERSGKSILSRVVARVSFELSRDDLKGARARVMSGEGFAIWIFLGWGEFVREISGAID